MEVCKKEGKFILRSGKESKFYIDKYQAFARAEILKPLTDHLARLIPPETEVLAGLSLGGIPLCTALCLKTGRDAVFIREQAKSHGTGKLIEGVEIYGKNVLIIEDITSTGGAIIEAVQALRSHGAKVNKALCMIRRQVILNPKMQDRNINLISLYSLADLENLNALEIVSEPELPEPDHTFAAL